MTITTKFIGPTNWRGARVKATSTSGASVTIPWDHALGIDENHERAADALARKLDHAGAFVGGWLPGASRVFVSVGFAVKLGGGAS